MPATPASNLAAIIPTRNRESTLKATLAALMDQTVSGFEIIVVVDGDDQGYSDLPPSIRQIRQPQAGPGAARNHGARSTDRSLILFLGDDMIPSRGLVEAHLRRHEAQPATEVAVLGHVDWHPDVADGRLNRWLTWSATQFDYDALSGEADADVGFGRFYSCNVSMKRELFLAVGGFDEDFVFYYEDLDAGYRLAEAGMRLCYEPTAVALHHHSYDWPSLEGRFRGIAVGERLMADRHPWFTPFFRGRVLAAVDQERASPLWAEIVDRVPASMPKLAARARNRANTWYYEQLAGPFLSSWEGDRDLAELKAYLGEAYDHERLVHHVADVEAEEEAAVDETAFYRTSNAYLYDLTVFAMSGTKMPYHHAIRRFVSPGSRLLDYGCGIGSDGLRFLEQGFDVSFADFDNPSAEYLRWRLQHRGLEAPVFDVEREVPGGFDVVYCFDVVEHVDDPVAFLELLESKAALVAVNFLDERPGDTHVHKPLDIPALLDRADRHGLRFYRLFHGRSHLVIYETGTPPVAAALRGRVRRALEHARRCRPHRVLRS